MKKVLKRIPYKHRIAIIIMLFTLIPVVFAEAIYINNIQSSWKQEALSAYQNDVDSCALLMSQSINNMLSKMDYVRNNYPIRIALSHIDEFSTAEAIDLISDMDDLVDSITADTQSLEIRWYPHNSDKAYGNNCRTLESLSKEFPLGLDDPLFQEITLLKENQVLWQIRDVQRSERVYDPPNTRLCLYTQLKNLKGSSCILEFSIPTSQIMTNRASSSIPGGLFAVCINNGNTPANIILDSDYSPEESNSLINHYWELGEIASYDTLCVPIPNVDSSYVIYIIPSTHARRYIQPHILATIAISVLLLSLVVGTCYLTSHFLTKRITYAVNQIKVDLSPSKDATTESLYLEEDINQISSVVQKMVQEAQDYSSKIARYEIDKISMELELLQMRFNPHLLYNTLGTIRYITKDPKARASIDSLCQYYRIVLNNGHLLIKLEDEIEMVKQFLSIEKFSYQLDNIEFIFDIDDNIKQKTIIKHLLQPIVENALNHGLRPAGQEHKGTLQIRATLINETIQIQVIDNGVGIPDNRKKQLLSAPSASTSGHGYGLYNVQQRVQLYYGKEYGIHIFSEINKGSVVTLTIPANSSNDLLLS